MLSHRLLEGKKANSGMAWHGEERGLVKAEKNMYWINSTILGHPREEGKKKEIDSCRRSSGKGR